MFWTKCLNISGNPARKKIKKRFLSNYEAWFSKQKFRGTCHKAIKFVFGFKVRGGERKEEREERERRGWSLRASNAILAQGKQKIFTRLLPAALAFLFGSNYFLKPSSGFWPCKLEIDFSFSSRSEGATYFYCWYTLPNQSLWCHFQGSSHWSWWATQHTCFAGFPWTAAVRSRQKHSSRTLSGSSHLTASSRTELGHPQLSSSLRR